MHSQSGISLIEVLVASLFFVLVGYGVVTGIKTVGRVSNTAEQRSGSALEIANAQRFMEKVGRLAMLCRKGTFASNDTLECLIDLTRPATGLMTWVRFAIVNSQLEYQKDPDAAGSFTAPVTQVTYPQVNKLVVCDDAAMNFGAGGSCPIEPTAISTFHTAQLVPGKENRFFRFQLEAAPSGRLATKASAGKQIYTSAFYRRNPPPFPSMNVVYQW